MLFQFLSSVFEKSAPLNRKQHQFSCQHQRDAPFCSFWSAVCRPSSPFDRVYSLPLHSTWGAKHGWQNLEVFMVRPVQFYGKANSCLLKYCDFCPVSSLLSVCLGVAYMSKTRGHLLLLILCMVCLHGCLQYMAPGYLAPSGKASKCGGLWKPVSHLKPGRKVSDTLSPKTRKQLHALK